MAAADQTSPLTPIPASVSPRWRGCRVLCGRSLYTAISSWGLAVLQDRMIWSSLSPQARPSSVDWTAERTMHSAMTSSEVFPDSGPFSP